MAPRITTKSGQKNKEPANHPWKALLKSRRGSFVCSQKTGRKGADPVRRSIRLRNYETN